MLCLFVSTSLRVSILNLDVSLSTRVTIHRDNTSSSSVTITDMVNEQGLRLRPVGIPYILITLTRDVDVTVSISTHIVKELLWGIGESKVVSSKGLEGYKMFNPRNSRRENKEKENA